MDTEKEFRYITFYEKNCLQNMILDYFKHDDNDIYHKSALKSGTYRICCTLFSSYTYKVSQKKSVWILSKNNNCSNFILKNDTCFKHKLTFSQLIGVHNTYRSYTGSTKLSSIFPFIDGSWWREIYNCAITILSELRFRILCSIWAHM